MATRSWASNSFWETPDNTSITTILTIVEDDGKIINQQLTVNKTAPDGSENPDFIELLEAVGEEKITQTTVERQERKKAEAESMEQKKLEQEKAKTLQNLFEAKIQAFEIEQIKNSQNRILKSKLRKAQNTIEVNIYAMMIVMEELQNAEANAAEEATAE